MKKGNAGQLIKALLVLAAAALVINAAIPTYTFADSTGGWPDPPMTDTVSCDTTQPDPVDSGGDDESTGDPLLDIIIDMVGWVL